MGAPLFIYFFISCLIFEFEVYCLDLFLSEKAGGSPQHLEESQKIVNVISGKADEPSKVVLILWGILYLLI